MSYSSYILAGSPARTLPDLQGRVRQGECVRPGGYSRGAALSTRKRNAGLRSCPPPSPSKPWLSTALAANPAVCSPHAHPSTTETAPHCAPPPPSPPRTPRRRHGGRHATARQPTQACSPRLRALAQAVARGPCRRLALLLQRLEIHRPAQHSPGHVSAPAGGGDGRACVRVKGHAQRGAGSGRGKLGDTLVAAAARAIRTP